MTDSTGHVWDTLLLIEIKVSCSSSPRDGDEDEDKDKGYSGDWVGDSGMRRGSAALMCQDSSSRSIGWGE